MRNSLKPLIFSGFFVPCECALHQKCPKSGVFPMN
jgi:hypothetical protein